MAVGPFLNHDSGFAELLSTADWTTDAYYAVLLANGSGTQDRTTEVDWDDISAAEISDADYTRQALASKTVAADSGNSYAIKFTCGKITFTAAGDISARYLYILKGTAASPVGTDKIVGHIDLTGAAENASSVNAEFSFTPHTTGLFYAARTAAP